MKMAYLQSSKMFDNLSVKSEVNSPRALLQFALGFFTNALHFG